MLFKKFYLKYIRPDLDEEIDEELTTAHCVINLCPSCGHSNCLIKTPHGIHIFQNLISYRQWSEHSYNCMRCGYVSKIRKVPMH